MGFCPSGLLSQWAFVRSPKISPHPSDNWIIKALYRLAIFDLSSADFFFTINFFEKIFQEYVLSGLIWVKAVCKMYQQMTLRDKELILQAHQKYVRITGEMIRVM